MKLTLIHQSYEDLAFGGVFHPEMVPDRPQSDPHPCGLPLPALVLLHPLSLFGLSIIPSSHPPLGEIPLPSDLNPEHVPGWPDRGSDVAIDERGFTYLRRVGHIW